MIDLKKGGGLGYKGFIAGEALLVAAVVAIGLLTQVQPARQGMNGASQKEAGAQTPSGEENASAASTALSAERAAETEPEPENGSDSAAYAKVKEDGEYVAEVIAPGGNEMYSEKELLLVNPWHLLLQGGRFIPSDLQLLQRAEQTGAPVRERRPEIYVQRDDRRGGDRGDGQKCGSSGFERT